MIGKLAEGIVKEFVEELRPDITAEIRKRLTGKYGDKKKAALDFADKLVDALCAQTSVSIYVRNKD